MERGRERQRERERESKGKRLDTVFPKPSSYIANAGSNIGLIHNGSTNYIMATGRRLRMPCVCSGKCGGGGGDSSGREGGGGGGGKSKLGSDPESDQTTRPSHALGAALRQRLYIVELEALTFSNLECTT